MPEKKAATKAVAKKNSVKEKPTVKTNVSAPTHDEIAIRAYAKWEEHGRHHGFDERHWLDAESEIRNQAEQVNI